jgi:hypothetical protein
MKNTLFVLAFVLSGIVAKAQYRITTVAGDSTYVLGDGGPATAAFLMGSFAVCTDAGGNLYIGTDNRIRKVNIATGIITTVAGGGTNAGENIPATNAIITAEIRGMCMDNSGNIYYSSDKKVRRIDAVTGMVKTVAGNGVLGTTDDAVQATSTFISPFGIALDGAGNLYIASSMDYTLRKVNLTTGIMNLVAGTPYTAGYTGDGGPATNATLTLLGAVAIRTNGDILLTCGDVIRKIDGSGLISTFAGGGTGGDGSLAVNTSMGLIWGVTSDTAGNTYAMGAESTSRRVWKINATTGVANIIAGGGSVFPGDGGAATAAYISGLSGITVNKSGSVIYVSSSYGVAYVSTVRKIYIPGVGINEIPQSHVIKVFPNPTNSTFRIETGLANKHEIIVCNTLGQRIISQSSKTASDTVDMHEQPSGVYFVTITYGEQRWTQRVTVTR